MLTRLPILLPRAAAVVNGDLSAAFAAPGAAVLPESSQAKQVIEEKAEFIKNMLKPVIEAKVGTANFTADQLICGRYTANGTGLDGVLETVKIETTSQNITITPKDPNVKECMASALNNSNGQMSVALNNFNQNSAEIINRIASADVADQIKKIAVWSEPVLVVFYTDYFLGDGIGFLERL